MYQPDLFRVDDVAQMHALMRARPLAALISDGALGLYASHLPTVLKEEGPFGVIECHLARANPHCEDLAGGEALMIFQGSDGYITPNWYPSKFQHGKVVPTWNYCAVHAYGVLQIHHDTGWIRAQVEALTAWQESASPQPWSVADAPHDYVEAMLKQIVGVEIAITRLYGKWKLSQNQPERNRAGVIEGLAERQDANGAPLRELMRERERR